jgi:SAM-dependent methyltransferase
MARRRGHDWEAELAAVADPAVTYPDYYTQPFHAYEQVGGVTRGCPARGRPGHEWLQISRPRAGPHSRPGLSSVSGRRRGAPAARLPGLAPGKAVWPPFLSNPHPTAPSLPTPPPPEPLQGNLSWDSALEVTLAAQSVHAGVMDPANKAFRPDGDAQLRYSYSARMRELMAAAGAAPGDVKAVADLGCATGLSSRALLEAFPGAAVTGVDLSPYFLAVGRYEQREREVRGRAGGQGSGEDCGRGAVGGAWGRGLQPLLPSCGPLRAARARDGRADRGWGKVWCAHAAAGREAVVAQRLRGARSRARRRRPGHRSASSRPPALRPCHQSRPARRSPHPPGRGRQEGGAHLRARPRRGDGAARRQLRPGVYVPRGARAAAVGDARDPPGDVQASRWLGVGWGGGGGGGVRGRLAAATALRLRACPILPLTPAPTPAPAPPPRPRPLGCSSPAASRPSWR